MIKIWHYHFSPTKQKIFWTINNCRDGRTFIVNIRKIINWVNWFFSCLINHSQKNRRNKKTKVQASNDCSKYKQCLSSSLGSAEIYLRMSRSCGQTMVYTFKILDFCHLHPHHCYCDHVAQGTGQDLRSDHYW